MKTMLAMMKQAQTSAAVAMVMPDGTTMLTIADRVSVAGSAPPRFRMGGRATSTHRLRAATLG